jgi:glycosyltransferase involved in cell wall biosynthesis
MRSLPDRSSNASALALANVFVLTSTWEASPLVILEAMASGLPWVSFDVGNVHDYPGGFIVSTVQEMADRVREIAHNPALASTLGRAGRDHVLRYNSWQKVIGEYEALFLELVPTVPAARVSQHDVPGEQPGEGSDG